MFERNRRVTAFTCIALAVVANCLLSASVVARGLDEPSPRDWKLLLASEKGDVKQVRTLLDLGASALCHDEAFGGTPLHWAAYKGHAETAEVLLNRGADINAINKDGRSALILAAAMGQAPVVQLLIERGADTNAKGFDGRSAVDWAKHWDRTAVLQLLQPETTQVAEKPQGADEGKETYRRSSKPTSPDAAQDMNPALVSAVNKGRVKKLKRLLDNGADPNAVDKASHSSLLMLAVRKGNENIISQLLEKGADPNIKDEARGTTPLMEASEKGFVKVVKMLLDKGADPNAVGPGSMTALIMAARAGRADVVGVLMDAHADATTTDDRGKTALQWAVKKGRTETAAMLLKEHKETQATPRPAASEQKPEQVATKKTETGPQPSTAQPTEAKLTPEERNKALIDAAEAGRLDEVETLVGVGADREAKDENGATPLLLAATNGRTEVAEWLVKNNANVNASNAAGLTPLAAAVDAGHGAVAELLLAHGADVNARSKDGLSALDRAIRKGSQELQTLLRQKGATAPEAQVSVKKEGAAAEQPADAKASAEKKPEPTPPPALTAAEKSKALLDAIGKGEVEKVRFLLEAGVDVNGKGPNNVTVLMTAAMQGNLEVVKLLVERGADPKAVDAAGKTALVYANEKGFREVSDFLKPRTVTEEKPQPQEATKAVPADQPPPGKHRVRAVSPETKAGTQTKPK